MNTQDLIRQWEGMSAREREAECALIDGWTYFEGEGIPWQSPTGVCFARPRKYTGKHSPRSLLDGLEAKVVEMVGFNDYVAMLWKVLALPMNSKFWTTENIKSFDACIRATAEQRSLACWLAVKGRSEGE